MGGGKGGAVSMCARGSERVSCRGLRVAHRESRRARRAAATPLAATASWRSRRGPARPRCARREREGG
eukprot:6188644-Pleurochrysis_carterae.AAC.1